MADEPKPDTQAWVTLAEAAAALGVSYEAVRQRVKSRSLRSIKGNDGKLRVFLNTTAMQSPWSQDPRTDTGSTSGRHTQDPWADRQGLWNGVMERDREIAALRHELGRREGVEQELRARLADKDAEIARLAERDRQVLDLQAERDRLRADHAAELVRFQHGITQLTTPWWRRWFQR